RGPAPRLLGEPRPHAGEPPGPRLRQAVPHGDLLPLTRAGGYRAEEQGRPRVERPLPQADRDRDRARADLLARRGVPPALPREEGPRELPHVVVTSNAL